MNIDNKVSEISISERFLQIQGHDIFARFLKHSDPNDDETAMIFLHDGLGSVESWLKIPEQLVECLGINAVIYDRRGYGRSSPHNFVGDPNYLHEEATEILPEILSRFGIKHPILIGHSDGATIALLYSGIFNHIDSLVVSIAPHTFSEKITMDGIGQLVQDFQNRNLKRKLTKLHSDKAETVFNSFSKTWLTNDFGEFNIFEILKKIKSPVLLIQGDRDEFGTTAQIDSVMDNASGTTESLIIENCGHFPHHSHKAIVVRAIQKFITSQPSI